MHLAFFLDMGASWSCDVMFLYFNSYVLHHYLDFLDSNASPPLLGVRLPSVLGLGQGNCLILWVHMKVYLWVHF